MNEAPYCAPPLASTHKPLLDVPAGACDTHVHVFGPADKYPYQDERSYTPPDCPPSELFKLHRTLGISRAVVVQASVHGIDNRSVLDAVKLSPDTLRAVAAVGPDVSDKELKALHEGGVRGLRFNLVDKGGMPFKSLNDLYLFSKRLVDLGWHIELLVHVDEIPDFPDLVKRMAVPVVVGHFGYMKTSKGIDERNYQKFLSVLGDGNCWVKMTGPYRISHQETPPYKDVLPFASKLLDVAPERLLWGSDWPHVMQIKPMPNDADLLDLFAQWVPQEALQKQILVDNPAKLYGFEASAS